MEIYEIATKIAKKNSVRLPLDLLAYAQYICLEWSLTALPWEKQKDKELDMNCETFASSF